MVNIRSPIGIVATDVRVANGWSCDGLVLTLKPGACGAHVASGLSSFVMISRVRPDGQPLQPSGQHFELLTCAKFVQTINADLNRLGVAVGDTVDTVDVFDAVHDRLQSHS